jgi:hypothetical protein
MKSSLRFARPGLLAALLPLLHCAASSSSRSADPPPAGGQSGDDGDIISPGLPPSPCEPSETRVPPEGLTAFGLTADELVRAVQPSVASPLFWVPFDRIAGTMVVPGSSQTELQLALEGRSEAALQIVQTPRAGTPADQCLPVEVTVPVRLRVTTADGALSENVDASLRFTNAAHAELRAVVPRNARGGSFDIIAGAGWVARGLSIEATLWPGGSRGSVFPALEQLGPPQPPPTSTPAPASLAPSATVEPLAVPAHWAQVAVWPQREVCLDGRGGEVYASNARIVGLSPLDLVAALREQGGWQLSTAEGPLSLDFEIQDPANALCVRTNGSDGGPALDFDVRARLRAREAPAGSPWAGLDASAVFELSARALPDGSAFDRLSWRRRDVVWSQSRGELATATGIQITADPQYKDFWWSWHGFETRAEAEAVWSTSTSIVVTSLNAEQAAEVDRVAALGGPGVGISYTSGTGFPELPGDELLWAESKP